MDIWSFLTQLGNAIFSGLLSFMHMVMNSVVYSIKETVSGLLGAVGIPFTDWSQDLANGNYGYSIPIIFVTILGIAFLIMIIFIDIYGFEQEAGDTIGTALKGIEL